MLSILLCAANARAQTNPNNVPENVSVVVPVVGAVTGPGGVRWKTDLELHNDTGQEMTVAVSLATNPDLLPLITTVPGGSSVYFPDIVGETFGLDSGLSPLLIQTMGRRSVTIHATAYGVRGEERFAPEPITINYGPAFYPLRSLPNLSFNDDFRTNIGLVNLGDDPAQFVLALQRLAGRNVAVTRFTVPPHTLWHVPIQFVFPLITSGDDFSILVETGSPDTVVYASVIENATSSAKFIQPTIGALGETDQLEAARSDQ